MTPPPTPEEQNSTSGVPNRVSRLEMRMDTMNGILKDIRGALQGLTKVTEKVGEISFITEQSKEAIKKLEADNDAAKEYIHETRGSMKVIIWVVGGLQGVILGCAIWAFNHILTNDQTTTDHTRQLSQITEQLQDITSQLRESKK